MAADGSRRVPGGGGAGERVGCGRVRRRGNIGDFQGGGTKHLPGSGK